MSSTFNGIEIARSAIVASQVALDVTGQNISNVNTKDYTRQSADLVSINYGSSIYRLAQTDASNVGQGVDVLKISQARDFFVDASVRNANSQYNTSNTILSALTDVENVMDETQIDGLHAMLNDFYKQLQSLSNNVGNVEYASMVRSSAEKVTQTFNQYATQLSQIRDEQKLSCEIAVDDMNTTIDKINEVNALIKDQTIRGSVPNELLDMRNSYLDTLSGYINITTSPQGDGTVQVTSGGINILKSTFDVSVVGDAVSILRSDGVVTNQAFSPSGGTIRGYLDILNGAGTYSLVGENSFRGLTYYDRALDSFAAAFAGTFNAINTLDTASPANLFDGTTAADISISDEWYQNADYIVVADEGTNDNVVKMINAMDNNVDEILYPGVKGTFEGYSRTLMNDNAVDVGYYADILQMHGNILTSVTNQRESITGVSTDEETINMVKYQRSYQAAARLMTMMDENLNTLINSMGLVGRS